MQGQSPGPSVKLLFRNLPNISLYIYTHIITTRVVSLKSHAHSVGLQAVQRSRYLERLLLFCRKTQRPTQRITYSTTLTESAGPAHRNNALCTRAGASLRWGAMYHRNHKYDQTTPKGRDSCRRTTDAVPFVLFSEKEKGCTILSFATTNESL